VFIPTHYTEIFEVVQLGNHALDITYPIAICIAERRRIDLVNAAFFEMRTTLIRFRIHLSYSHGESATDRYLPYALSREIWDSATEGCE